MPTPSISEGGLHFQKWNARDMREYELTRSDGVRGCCGVVVLSLIRDNISGKGTECEAEWTLAIMDSSSSPTTEVNVVKSDSSNK